MRGQPVFSHTVKSLNTGQCTLVLLLFLQIFAGQNLYGAELPTEEYPNLEYTYDVIQDHVERQLNDTFIAATFSGGGMRAAALAYGALRPFVTRPLHPTTNSPTTQGNRI